MKENWLGKVLVTNVQRFSLHDGPGIRTTVFLKGCTLRCPWCANPENIVPSIELYKKNGIDTTIGRYMSCDELYDIIMRDKVYYENGGVTFSGGEPLVQVELIKPLLERLKREGIHLCVESALFISQKNLSIAIEYFDLFYVDIKMLDRKRCYEILKGDIEVYIKNFEYLCRHNKKMVVRMPVISEYTFDVENVTQIASFLEEHGIKEIEILKEHNLGISKYEALGKAYCHTAGITMENMEQCKSIFEKKGIFAKICYI